MDVDRYLNRIGFNNVSGVDSVTFEALHRCHVNHIPFENLDIHYKKLFDLDLENIYKKVVENNRGGFCYELNLLFNELLCSLGFQSRIIEARIFTDKGELGPPFDHMSVLVELDKLYLADVGFGDLFLTPLELREGIQSDGRSQFKIEKLDDQRFLLLMSKEDKSFEKKYEFNLAAVRAEDFSAQCFDKQTNSESYFVKHFVCTKPTDEGRITIFNNSFVERRGDERLISRIEDESQLLSILSDRFEIT